MFNIISALVVIGALSASGAAYMLNLEEYSEEVTKAYVSAAEERFSDYEKMLPGVVEWQIKPKTLSLD